MTSKRRVAIALFLAVLLGALVALPLGSQRRISLELWLLVAGLWFGLATAGTLLRAAPLAPTPLRWLFGVPTPEPEPEAKTPRNLQALEGTVIGGRDGARAYQHRLRPRLSPIVSHGLLTNHGVDIEREPDRAAALLGDLAWMVDSEVNDRTPDFAAVNALLDLVTHSHSTSSHPTSAPVPDVRTSGGPPPGEQRDH